MTPTDYSPNAEAFFAAFEAVVQAGFIIVVALVVIVTIKRLVS